MARYTLVSLIAGLIMPVLAGVAGFLGILLGDRFSWWSLKGGGLAASLLACGLPTLFSLLAGWLLTSRRTLPATLKERYTSLLVLPPLIWLMALSLYPPLVDPELFSLGLVLLPAAAGWLLFTLGAFWGARKHTPARERSNGLIRMAGYIGLAFVVIGANLYGIVSNTLYGERDNSGNDIFLPAYFPFENNGLLATPAIPPSLRIAADYPLIDGDIHLLPLYGAVVQAVYEIRSGEYYAEFDPETDDEPRPASPEPHVRDVADYKTSTECPLNFLMNNEIDIVFGDLPAARQFVAEVTDEAPELIPIACDALVFFVHKDNPVTNLSLEQIRNIYAGEIQSWEKIGGPDTKILAFQSNDARTQQALTDMVMRDRETIEPLREEFNLYDLNIVNRLAEYRNRTNALGYDFRWRANRLFPAGEIRFLSIDGIAPTPENIRNGTYPLILPLVMATRQKPRKEVAALRDWICGPEGQALIDLTGFVSIRGGIDKKEKQ